MSTENQNIKECSSCKSCWRSLGSFLSDKKLIFIGYQSFFKDPGKGSFLFTHDKEGCGTTFSVEVWKFKELLEKEVEFAPFKPNEHPNCELRCVQETDLRPCAEKRCNGNVIRGLMQIIKKHIRTPVAPLSEEEIDRIIDGDS